MKSAMCYSGIIIVIVLILVPPILRLTVPQSLFEEAKEEEIHQMNLRCSSDRYFVTTNYKDNIIQAIIVKKIIPKASEEKPETSTNPSSNPNNNIPEEEEIDFDNVFDHLKEQKRNDVIVQEDGEVLSFDFTTSGNGQYDLTKLIQPLEQQRIYYESQKMVCSVLT